MDLDAARRDDKDLAVSRPLFDSSYEYRGVRLVGRVVLLDRVVPLDRVPG